MEDDDDDMEDKPPILAMCEVCIAQCLFPGRGEWLEEGKHPPQTCGWEVVGARRSFTKQQRRFDLSVWGGLGHSTLEDNWHQMAILLL